MAKLPKEQLEKRWWWKNEASCNEDQKHLFSIRRESALLYELAARFYVAPNKTREENDSEPIWYPLKKPWIDLSEEVKDELVQIWPPRKMPGAMVALHHCDGKIPSWKIDGWSQFFLLTVNLDYPDEPLARQFKELLQELRRMYGIKSNNNAERRERSFKPIETADRWFFGQNNIRPSSKGSQYIGMRG